MSDDNKICFMIPIYPDHYKYLTFLNKLNSEHTFTIIFILTSINDKKLLINLLNNKKFITSRFSNIKFITLEENTNVCNYINNFNDKNLGIINIKKFYGLYYLINNLEYDNYDYIAVIDSEIEFINLTNLYSKFKLYCEKKIVIAGNTTIRNNIHNFLDNIHIKSIEHFNNDDIKIINSESNNGKYYFWYSDINIYDRKILPDFFKYIRFDDSDEKFSVFIKKITFWSFDYVIYYYYCIVFHNYRIECMESYDIKRQWSMEAAPYEIYIQVKNKINYTSTIVIGNCYYKNNDKFIKENNEPVFVYNINDCRYNNIYNRVVDYLDN
jgi:hypothetical protein